MTDAVKNFIETNWHLLEIDQNEFFHSAYNGLSIPAQKELVEVLDEAGIETQKARETVLYYIITMTMEGLERSISLKVLIHRYFCGLLGFDEEWLLNYILDNQKEWDNEIDLDHGIYYVYPVD